MENTLLVIQARIVAHQASGDAIMASVDATGNELSMISCYIFGSINVALQDCEEFGKRALEYLDERNEKIQDYSGIMDQVSESRR